MATFKTTYRVAAADTDASGAVYIANYLNFFQRAEEDLYLNIGCNLQEIMNNYNIWIRKTEAFCRVKNHSKFNDLLEIEIKVNKIEERSIEYCFTLRQKKTGTIVAKGRVIEIAEDKQSGNIVNIPSELLDKLKNFTGCR